MRNKEKTKLSNFAVARRMIGLVKPLAGVMVIAILAGTLGYLAATFITIFGGYALLNLTGFSAAMTIKTIFISVLVFGLLRGILRYIEQYSNHHIAFKLLAIIRDEVFTALRRLAPAKLETRDKGNLITMITTDVELLEVFYAHTISPIAIAFLTSGFMVVFIAQYHIVPALIALTGYLTVGVIIPRVASGVGRDVGQAYRDQNGALSSKVLEVLRGLRELIQFGRQDAAVEDIKEDTEALGTVQKQLKKHEGHTVAITNTAILFFSLLTLVATLLLYNAGQVSFAGVLIPTIAVMGSFGPVVALSNLSANLVHTFASARRVIGLLDEEPETDEITDGVDVPFGAMVCDDISFAYDEELVLDSVDITVAPNTILGISGKSGSGKTTLLQLLMRFWDVDSGTISMNGEALSGINTASLRRQQSLVTQDTELFHDTIENNIKIAKLDATRDEVIDAAKKASVHSFIETLPNGYDTMVGELGSTLSGGASANASVWQGRFYTTPR